MMQFDEIQIQFHFLCLKIVWNVCVCRTCFFSGLCCLMSFAGVFMNTIQPKFLGGKSMGFSLSSSKADFHP